MTPLVLLFSPYKWLTVAAVVLMVAFTLFITSTFPLAVALEWNIPLVTRRCSCSSASPAGTATA